MAEPVTVVVSGGVPVVDATPLSGTALTNPTTYGVPVTPVESGARPVTIVASGAPPIVFIAENGVDYLLGGASSPPAGAYTLTAGAGAFVLSGETMTPLVNFNMAAALGAFTLTGNDVTLTGTSFSPSSLTPNLWVEARNGVFQTIDGTTTAATANSDPVGYLPDLSGNTFHLTAAANDGTRPTLQGVGVLPYVSFDGTDDVLRRAAALSSYNSGSGFTYAIVFRSNSNATSARVIAEGSSGGGNPIMTPLQAQSGTATSSGAFYRNDSGANTGTGGPTTGNTPSNANVFNGSDHVFIYTDDGTTISSASNIATYLDGAAGATLAFTRNGTSITVDRFALGALVRNTTGNWWAGRVYGMVVVHRVLDSTERGNLTTYLGNLAGLTL
jgi:hypothetical protein